MTQSPGGEADRKGLFVALKNTLATLIAIGKTRAELLVTELEEENSASCRCGQRLSARPFAGSRRHHGSVLPGPGFLGTAGDGFRPVRCTFIVGGVMLVASLKRQAAQPSKMFKASLSELEDDMAQLRRYRNKSE